MPKVPLFEGRQTAATIIAVPVRIYAGCIGLHVQYDAVAAATFVLELSSAPYERAPVYTGTKLAGGGDAGIAVADAVNWPDSGEVIAALVAGTAGSFLINISNVRQQRGRLRISASANASWVIWDGLQLV